MSIKARITAGAATFALVGGGLSMLGTLTASAATPPCTGDCVQLFSQKYGPKYVTDVYQARAAAGTPVILFQASNSDPAEDFSVSFLGTVHSFYEDHGLVSPQFDRTYAGDEVAEVEYAPYGLNSNFCLSTESGVTPQPGSSVMLESCGQYANSLFAIDAGNEVADRRSAFGDDFPLINGASVSFSNPLVLNYPAGNPTDMPRPQLNVQPEKTYSGGTVFDNQEWGIQGSPVHGTPLPPP
jgi:hypothetical protein